MARYYPEMPWGIEDIMKALPHRYPFLLVDRVMKIDQAGVGDNREGSEIVAEKCVTINEPFFPGHFPIKPIMPGVLIIEALAQTSALLCYKPIPEGFSHWDFFIAGVQDAKFRKPVVPGDRLELHSKVIRDRPSLNIFETWAVVDGQTVTEAKLMAKMVAVR